jgi:hypothetical protein
MFLLDTNANCEQDRAVSGNQRVVGLENEDGLD